MTTPPTATAPTRPRRLVASLIGLLSCLAMQGAPAEIAPDDLDRFVRGYLQAAQQPTIEAEVAHYGDKVRYFNNGTVSQDFVAADQRRYYKLWPERSFTLLDAPVVMESEAESATVKFVIRYNVGGAGRSASGMTENTMKVQRVGEALKIVAISERKVKAAKQPTQNDVATPLPEVAQQTTPTPATRPKTPKPAPREKPTPKPELQELPEPQGPASTMIQEGPQTTAAAQAATEPVKATPVPGSPGLVYPPGAEQTPKNMVDVRGMTPGQKVRDPHTGKIFLVP